MTDTATRTAASDQRIEHFDVLIVGAGISGIGSAHHLREQCPDKSFAVLEAMPSFGGTWRTHRYPGARSDSDLYTYGYRFKPWTGAPIASKDEIMKYLGEVIESEQLEPFIRYGHTITNSTWSSAQKRWILDVTRGDTGEHLQFSASFLWMCQGYYRHSEGHTPQFKDMDAFKGLIVHPQTWPEDFDYSGKRVVVIGSGATAATLIPAMAPDCSHITMLQRSPTFFIIGSNVNEVADMLRELDVPEEWVHEIVRRKLIADLGALNQIALEYPDFAREELLKPIREILGDDFDIDKHFNPKYRPWQQRIAFIPEGDLFHGIKSGKASVVTDEIDRFVEDGILLKSGTVLEADIIITATGFDMNVLGDIDFNIDGVPLDYATTVTYRGMMFTGIPNMIAVFGYFRASWTLRVDIIGDFVCRLLNHMTELGRTVVTPTLREQDQGMTLHPWIDPEDFNPGYLTRSLPFLPKQGDREPWRHSPNYQLEKVELAGADLDDGTLRYS
jgi:cation diffusion facilitator CzcD-associated flavoprotein CzcO